MEKPIRFPEKQNHTRVHGSAPHKKDNNLRPQPNGDHGLLSSKWPTIGRFDSPQFWGSNLELRRSQLLNTVHPPLYSKWNLSKNQTQTLGNPIQDAYGKSRSLIFVKKYGTWIDPFPGLLVTTSRWLPGSRREGAHQLFPTRHSTLPPAAGHQHQRGILQSENFIKVA